MSSKHLDLSKLISHAYDGASVFSGHKTGVQVRIRTHSAHALYIHCACHRLQLAAIQAADSNLEFKFFFGMMTSMWKLFYYSPKKAELLKEVQAVLNLPELKIVKPSETRWLSHERCARAICKELPALIKTCQQLHESGGDAEAYGLSVLLASKPVIYGLVLLSEVLDILAKFNATMQSKSIDISRISSLLQVFLAELEGLREATAEWCSKATSLTLQLEKEYNLTLSDRRMRTIEQVDRIQEFRRRKSHPLSGLLDSTHQE